jgi:hypothetical protein
MGEIKANEDFITKCLGDTSKKKPSLHEMAFLIIMRHYFSDATQLAHFILSLFSLF